MLGYMFKYMFLTSFLSTKINKYKIKQLGPLTLLQKYFSNLIKNINNKTKDNKMNQFGLL